jgi:hypothetical protein
MNAERLQAIEAKLTRLLFPHGGWEEVRELIEFARETLADQAETTVADLSMDDEESHGEAMALIAALVCDETEMDKVLEAVKDWGPKDIVQRVLNWREERDEQQARFDLAWSSDMRAIKMWQAETGEELTWPSSDRLCVWLMRKNDELRKQIATKPEGSVER